MVVSTLKKVMIVALVAALASSTVGASAATPDAKKISVAQGKKIYDKAVKATNAWLTKTPHTTTYRSEDISDDDQDVDTRVVSIDGDKNVLIVEDGVETYLIGDTYYVEYDEGDLSDYELELAQDLGLNLDTKYAIINPLLLDPDYSFEDDRNVYNEVNDRGFTGNRKDARSTTVTYRKTGSTEILTVTLQYGAKKGSPSEKQVLTTKIERGRITALSDTYISSGESFKVTISYKPYIGTIIAPAGPYLEWDKVYLDPRYSKMTDEKVAGLVLESYVREAKAIAAFEGLDELTIEVWTILKENYDDMVLYDRGIEFTFSSDDEEEKRACGVFTDYDALLEMSSCAELGFTEL
jgi:hypothetical protein